MLVPAVERDGEDCARFPLESDPGPGIVPYRGGATAGQHQDHLLKEMVLRRELLAWRDLANITIIGGARRLMVDEHPIAVPARPGLELDRTQVRHVLRADDVEALGAHEAQIRGVLLGLELVRQFLRDDCVLGHEDASSPFASPCFTSASQSLLQPQDKVEWYPLQPHGGLVSRNSRRARTLG